MTTPLDWTKLLCDTRLRNLIEGNKSASYADVVLDQRSEFEKDYDRVVFATPVRRLQDKTQVFPLDPVDSVRTRLTHSLEVSSIAKNLAVDVARSIRAKRPDVKLPQNAERHFEAICAACGLLHDIGNPPFGHPGEDTLINWVRSCGQFAKIGDTDSGVTLKKEEMLQQQNDYLHFNGNAQTFRLITKLQVLADFYGLNLTAATLATALKYTAGSHELTNESMHESSKLGYFASENDVVSVVRNATGLAPRQRHPLAHVVEAADDIAYSAVDIEDAIRKGVIEWDDFREYIKKAAGPKAQGAFDYVDRYFSATRVRSSFDGDKRNRGEAEVQIFRTAAILKHAETFVQVFMRRYDNIMDGSYHHEITRDPLFEEKGFVRELKEFAKKHVWHSRPNIKLEILGHNVIQRLLDTFANASFHQTSDGSLDLNGSYNARVYSLMSSNYRRVYQEFRESKKLDPRYVRLQLIVDYVCGMTDTFAVSLANELATIRRL